VPGPRRWVAVAAALVPLAACTTQDPPPLPVASASPVVSPAPATTGAPTAGGASPSRTSDEVGDAAVLRVYREWWKALEGAYATADPDDLHLDDYAVDPILSRQRATLRTLREQGIVQRTTFTLRPRLLYRTDEYAEVEDCVRGPANTYYDVATGTPRAPRGYRNDVPTEDRLLVTLQRRGDRWFVVAGTAGRDVQC
jgi:hypothetical protein